MNPTTPATVRVGDVGILIRLTVERDGAAVNLSGAAAKSIAVYDPEGVLAATLAGSFTTDGTDGQLQATSTSACFTRAGPWRAVGIVTGLSAFSGTTEPVVVRAVGIPWDY